MIAELVSNKVCMGDRLASLMASGRFKQMKMMVAFVKQSGVGRLYNDFRNFINAGGSIEGIVGIDYRGTSMQGLQQLVNLSNNNIYIHHDGNQITFHPKVFIFNDDCGQHAILIGSTNLTCGGLYTNYEANALLLSENTQSDSQFISDIKDYYQLILSDNNTKKIDQSFVANLFTQGLIEDETQKKNFAEAINHVTSVPFKGGKLRYRPPALPPIRAPRVISTLKRFVTTLSNFDVSVRSLDPVILIPLKALRQNSAFWDWPDSFTLSGGGYPERYSCVDVIVSGNIVQKFYVRIYFYAKKDEFRLQCEPIKRNGTPGDIMLINRTDKDRPQYEISLIRKGTVEHKKLLKKCVERVSPQKLYGYF